MQLFPLPRRALLAAVLVVAALPYVRTVTHGFVLDDHDLLERVIPAVHTPLDAWFAGAAFQTYYRPVFITSLALDHLLFGSSPAGYHAVNLVLQLLAVWCGFLLAEKIFHNAYAAAAAALLFALQPVHTENVSWISGRTDILSAIFLFLALSAFYDVVRERKSKLAWISAGWFFLALASKEVAVVFPALCVVLLIVWNSLPAVPAPAAAEQGKRRRKPRTVARRMAAGPVVLALFLFAACAGALLILRAVTMNAVFTENSFTTASDRWLNAARCFALYVWHAFAGGGYSYLIRGWRVVDPHYNLALPLDTTTWVEIGATIFAFAVALYAALLWRRGAAAFGLAGFALFVLPALGFVPIQSIFSVRFLYLPSFFLSLAAVDVAFAIRGKFAWKPVAFAFAALFAGVAVWWGYAAFVQDADWKSDVTLFTSMKQDALYSPVLYFSLGNGYRYEGDYMDAAQNFARAVQLFPRYRDAYINLGASCMLLGQRHAEYYSDAIDAYDQALQYFPRDAKLYMMLGDVYARQGDTQRAIQNYATSFSLDKSPEIRKRLDQLNVQLPGE